MIMRQHCGIPHDLRIISYISEKNSAKQKIYVYTCSRIINQLMIESIFSGIGLGVALSFLTGPAFFALLKTSLEKGFYSGVFFAAGILLSDVIYIGLTIFGSTFISVEQEYLTNLGIAGSIVLLSVGLYYLFNKVRITKEYACAKRRHTGYLLKGFLMCVLNPALLLYWVSITGGFLSVSGRRFEPGTIIPFFACILITQFSIDCLKAYYADKLSYRIEEKTLGRFSKFAGILIIVFALRLMYDSVMHTLV
jgi:amino acid exporter